MMNQARITKNDGHSKLPWMAALLIFLLLAWPMICMAADIADGDITERLKQELTFDPAVPVDDINVSTDKGIVTISGNVSSLLAKERATMVAETLRGVRSVINLIKVQPRVDRSAAILGQSVETALLYDAATESYEIDVNADDNGRVTMTGTVDSWAERELAETVAKSVSGVTSINNQIIVKPKAERADTDILPEIQKRLRMDALVDDALIDVRVNNGEVKLSGIVGSAAEKRRAEWNAWVSDVVNVDSAGLKVERWARDEDLRTKKYIPRSDTEIREAVQDALLADPRVSPFVITVNADNGIVTLSGIAGNAQAKRSAVRDARNTVGVISIKDMIKIRPIVKLDDVEIAGNVHSALLRNPFTEDLIIAVEVKDGVVHLKGSVDSYFEKAKAEDVAFRARGVTEVKNNLAVTNPVAMSYNPYIHDWSIHEYTWYGDSATVTSKSDLQITEDIKNELRWSPFIDLDDVNISVDNGIATLTGTVDSWNEYYAARENALEGGAITVVNKINVR